MRVKSGRQIVGFVEKQSHRGLTNGSKVLRKKLFYIEDFWTVLILWTKLCLFLTFLAKWVELYDFQKEMLSCILQAIWFCMLPLSLVISSAKKGQGFVSSSMFLMILYANAAILRPNSHILFVLFFMIIFRIFES